MRRGRRGGMAAAVLLVLGLGAPAYARFDLIDHSARATGRGGAFVATADDGSAVYYNPAGLARIEGSLVQAGLMNALRRSKYESPAGEHDKLRQLIRLPHLYAVLDPGNEQWKWGIGMFIPFGSSTKWGDDSPLRYASTFVQLKTMAVNPSVAYKPRDDLSLGFGLTIYSGSVISRNKIDFGTMIGAPGAFDGNFELLSDDAYAVGYNLGFLWQAREKLRLGMSYRSRFDLYFKGQATITDIPTGFPFPFTETTQSSRGKAKYRFPDVFMVGAAYDVTQRLNVGADFQWTNWSRFNGYFIDFETNNAFFTDAWVAKDYQDSFIYKVGAEYALTENMKVRCGAAYSSEAVPAATFEPANPSNRRYSGYLGWGYVKNGFHLDIALGITRYADRYVENNVAGPVDGTYKTILPQAGVSTGWAF